MEKKKSKSQLYEMPRKKVTILNSKLYYKKKKKAKKKSKHYLPDITLQDVHQSQLKANSKISNLSVPQI